MKDCTSSPHWLLEDCSKKSLNNKCITLSIRGIYDDVLWCDRNNSVCKVIACKEPTNDGNSLLIASSALAVDQDDAVHGMGVSLNCGNSYFGPGLVKFFKMSEEELCWNLVLHVS